MMLSWSIPNLSSTRMTPSFVISAVSVARHVVVVDHVDVVLDSSRARASRARCPLRVRVRRCERGGQEFPRPSSFACSCRECLRRRLTAQPAARVSVYYRRRLIERARRRLRRRRRGLTRVGACAATTAHELREPRENLRNWSRSARRRACAVLVQTPSPARETCKRPPNHGFVPSSLQHRQPRLSATAACRIRRAMHRSRRSCAAEGRDIR
jgi:hypothetical protein